MNQCHMCQKSFQGIFKAKCCKPRCSKGYCLECIHKFFSKEFEQANYRKDTWICYSCQQRCQCRICKGIGIMSVQKKIYKKRNQQNQSLNSSSNLQANNLINEIESIFKESELEGMPPFLKKIMLRKKLFYAQVLRDQQQKNCKKGYQKPQINSSFNNNSLNDSINYANMEKQKINQSMMISQEGNVNVNKEKNMELLGNAMKQYADLDDDQDIEIME